MSMKDPATTRGSTRRVSNRHATSRRVALVHDFFVTEGGADRCAVEFASLLPDARVYTSFFDAARFGDRIDPSRVRTWPLQRMPGASSHFRSLLPLYPAYFSMLDLRRAELVLSSSIAFSKAVRTGPQTLHVSYVYTPLRYAWDLGSYLEGASMRPLARIGARTAAPLLRSWDRATASRPDVVIAISETVKERIRALWGRDSEVLYPPVDVEEIAVSGRDDGFLLVAARMLAYRRLDLVVRACRERGRPLVLVGEGPELTRLQALAGSETTFAGFVARDELLDLMARCSAYVVPGVEDFGIAPVEAMAAGKPVVAFRAGGVRETVVDGVTGVFFDEPTSESLGAALDTLDSLHLDRLAIRAQAERFDRRLFLERWRALFARYGVDPSLYSAG